MERQWFVAARSGLLGPMEGAAVVALVRSGGARPDTQVCSTDERQWVEMRHVPELGREMAQQDAMAMAAPYVPAPPPPPGEPWFYNVPIGRAAALQWLSFGFYFGVWEHRHQAWLRRRTGPQISAERGVEALLPTELVSAHAQLGLSDPRLRLRSVSEWLYALAFVFVCLLPIVAVIQLQFILTAQAAAEKVNREVAPGAARPLMGLGEWVAVAGGLVPWSFVAILLWLLSRVFRAF